MLYENLTRELQVHRSKETAPTSVDTQASYVSTVLREQSKNIDGREDVELVYLFSSCGHPLRRCSSYCWTPLQQMLLQQNFRYNEVFLNPCQSFIKVSAPKFPHSELLFECHSASTKFSWRKTETLPSNIQTKETKWSSASPYTRTVDKKMMSQLTI